VIIEPYLIQRARIISPLTKEGERLSNAVRFDYMGSAEFEFGALPKSFRRIQAKRSLLKLRKVEGIKFGELQLRVLSTMTDEEFAEYSVILKTLRGSDRKIRTKEATQFNEDYKPYDEAFRNDFWWDICNDAMFTFHKQFANRLITYVDGSLAYMDEQTKSNA
jgi:hypothetical protein